jgi:hypothetical protein
MKKIVLLAVLFITVNFSNAQLLLKKGDISDASLPQWVKMMYAESPNVLLVEKAHDEYYETHAEEENHHTAYYKHWRRYIQPYMQEDGSIKFPSQQERKNLQQRTKNISQSSSSKMLAPWNFTGPDKNFRARYNAGDPVAQISWHANVYCIDQSTKASNPFY